MGTEGDSYKLPPPPRKGLPTKLEVMAGVQETIVRAIERGNYVEVAAALAGISKQTLYNWLKKGDAQKRGRFRDFKDAVEKAMAIAEDNDVKVLDGAKSIDWKAAAFRLERKHPDRWGRKDRVQVDQNNRNIDDNLDYSKLSLEELKFMDEIRRKAKADGGEGEK